MNSNDRRYSGVLLHPTSLPSPYGIGDLGQEAYDFVDFLKLAEVRLWQVLPLGPTGFGNSPYASRSTFAGNEQLLSLDVLVKEGYLTENEVASPPPFPSDHVDYSMVNEWKLPLLKRAAQAFLNQGSERAEYQAFCRENTFWLSDYALFMVLYERYQDARWFSVWNREESDRDPDALQTIRDRYPQQIELWKVLQYFFEKQWQNLKSYANAQEVSIVGDIPIFVAADSVDTWSHLELFKTDAEGHYSEVSGVPPDFFSSTGQLWGNPVYDWEKMKKDNYAWWMQRIRSLFHQTDIVRIDHFRGFESYWEVPYGNKTAENGTWVKAPGKEFFAEVKKQMGTLPILAEDLGFITPEVEALRRENGFPGMRICEFGFSRDSADWPNSHDTFLPHHYPYNCVAYTGTHDNDTVKGWYDHLSWKDKDRVQRYFACEEKDLVWSMVRTIMASHAKYAIFPMQDLLFLGSEARMNIPSTCGAHNWSWRMKKGANTKEKAECFSELVGLYARNGKLAEEEEQEHLREQNRPIDSVKMEKE
jgi:4-alpha-glucanotransferase